MFHLAADYRLWAPDPGELYRSNVDGTRNLLQAARNAGVERVVYTSTVGCIGIPKGGGGDENCAVTIEEAVPRWMKESGSGRTTGGWLTAEYSMLPYSTLERKPVLTVTPQAC